MGAVVRSAGVMALALVLVGCAGNRVNQPSESSLADLRARLSMGQCTPELTAQVIAAQQAPLHLEAAYQCLTNARLELSEQLLSDYRNSFAQRADQDYAAYLAALIPYARFELAAGDSQQRLEQGRAAHGQMVAFVRAYPQSQYRSELAERMESILQGMAQAEYDLALVDAEHGQQARAERRMRYLRENYPRTPAATSAIAWLIDQRSTQD